MGNIAYIFLYLVLCFLYSADIKFIIYFYFGQPFAFVFSQGLKLVKYSWFLYLMFLNIYDGREFSSYLDFLISDKILKKITTIGLRFERPCNLIRKTLII